MGFFSDLGDAITGQGKRDLAALQLETQLKMAEQQAEIERQRNMLKMDPALAKVKNVRYIAFTIIGIITLYILIKYVF